MKGNFHVRFCSGGRGREAPAYHNLCAIANSNSIHALEPRGQILVSKPIFDSSLVPFQSNRRTEPSVTPLELAF